MVLNKGALKVPAQTKAKVQKAVLPPCHIYCRCEAGKNIRQHHVISLIQNKLFTI